MRGCGLHGKDSLQLKKAIQVSLLLTLMTLILYWPVQSFEFVNFDDDTYVAGNRQVQRGLSFEGLKWSLGTFQGGNWHPLTWFSHMADVEAYGLYAGGHHWTNVLIHTASAVLLFLVLAGITNSTGASALVAALFAFHPLHVESVAWVAERKDVLSGFFWILTIGTYSQYTRQPTILRYLLVLGSFMLGLMSKPMVVTLPFVLLLLDYWPLGRSTGADTAFDKWVRKGATPDKQVILRLALEKIPLLVMAAASCLVTVCAQQSINSVASLGNNPIEVRVANALVTYARYIQKMLWPVDLSVFYPHAGLPPAWMTVTSFLVIIVMSYFAVRKCRVLPFLLVGWFWYLGTLVPVIGLVQVGSQSMADRYTYIPLVGLFIVMAWGAKRLVAGQPGLKHPVAIFSLVAVAGLLFLARSQVETWKNSMTLFEHALTINERNALAHNNVGAAYDVNDKSCKRALPHYMRAVELKEDYADAYDNLGTCAYRAGKHEEAIRYFRKAVEINPQFSRARINLGLVMMKCGMLQTAEEEFNKVLAIDASMETAHINLSAIFIQQGRLDDAATSLREALRINPENAEAHNNIGVIFLRSGRIGDALRHFRLALNIAPGHPAAEQNIQHIMAHMSK